MTKIQLIKGDCLEKIKEIECGSIDLVLTDPPYGISRETGYANVINGVQRFAVSMEFGEWDYTPIDLDTVCREYFRVLKDGGTCIVFYDLWKLSYLSEAMQRAEFKMIRLIIWEKSNPVPLNSKRNYLTGAREIAVLGVKKGKPTFHSEYDKGVYQFPIPNNGKRYHPTQKPLELMEALIQKHSNEGDMVLDTFMGSGTTGVACKNLNRNFIGIELDTEYFKIADVRIKELVDQTSLFGNV